VFFHTAALHHYKRYDNMPLAKAQTKLEKQNIHFVEWQFLSLTKILQKNCFLTQNFIEIGQSAAGCLP